MACACTGACRQWPYRCGGDPITTATPNLPMWWPGQLTGPTVYWPTIPQTGWICPRCHRVNAPTSAQCTCAPAEEDGGTLPKEPGK